MNLQCTWNEKMKFTAVSEGHNVSMDALAPIGSSSAMTPKQLLLAGICGCTGMDVVALLKKYKQSFESFEISAEAGITEGVHPVIFKEIKLIFKAHGSVEAVKFLEAVRLSQTKYCGVTAMVSKAVPISYTIELNGANIGSGQADFN